MKIGLPDGYPSTIELPFNQASLDDHFSLSTPDQDPGGDGHWLLLEGHHLLTENRGGMPQMPRQWPLATGQEPLYIGQWQGAPCRLLGLDKGDCSQQLEHHLLLANEPRLPLPLLSLAGIGRMILHWEEVSRYCGNCGTLMERLPGQWGKACPTCRSHHFPRIHPCVIGLIVRQEEILLVRKPEWPDGRFGLVAGFVEFGECLEEAMAREILEETGLRVDNLRYIGSQCWPFPSQLMCGFVADYRGGELKLQRDELAEARWCRIDQLPTLPPRRSIARYLIDRAGDFLCG